jgi:hypothetical protein
VGATLLTLLYLQTSASTMLNKFAHTSDLSIIFVSHLLLFIMRLLKKSSKDPSKSEQPGSKESPPKPQLCDACRLVSRAGRKAGAINDHRTTFPRAPLASKTSSHLQCHAKCALFFSDEIMSPNLMNESPLESIFRPYQTNRGRIICAGDS